MSNIKKTSVVLFLLAMMLLSQQVSAKETRNENEMSVIETEDIDPLWGPIFEMKAVAGYHYFEVNNITLEVPTMQYRVVGFGNHMIEYELRINLTFTDGTWDNRSYSGLDCLYTILRPFYILLLHVQGITPWKLVADGLFEFPGETIAKGSFWSIRLTVDRGEYVMDSEYVL